MLLLDYAKYLPVIELINEMHNASVFKKEDFDGYDDNEAIRSKYNGNSLGAAYALKSRYIDKNIMSNTIVFKLRPDVSNSKLIRQIKSSEESSASYFHAVEIAVSHGKFKVLDVLNTDDSITLSNYLDNLCKINNVDKDELRYDLGMLAPANINTHNNKVLMTLLNYLDRTYKIGKPYGAVIDVKNDDIMLISDEVVLDISEFCKESGIDIKGLDKIWLDIYGKLLYYRMNILMALCSRKLSISDLLYQDIEQLMFSDDDALKFMTKK